MSKVFPVVALLLCSLLGQAQGWRQHEAEVRVYFANPSEIAILKDLNFNFEAAGADGLSAMVYLVPSEIEILRKTRIRYQVVISDLNQYYQGYWDNPLVPPGYYSYEQIVAIADSLATHFPQICKKVVLGNSVNNRQLAALKISDNVGTDEPEAEILFDGGIHGDEVGGSQNLIMYARALCKGYGSNPLFTSLIDSREIWLFLMVNPDGRVSMSRYNANMVDCNRDCGYMWGAEGNSSGAYSQIETKTLRNLLFDNQFSVYTNIHSGIEILSYPWSYRGDMTRDHNHINNLASVYSSSSGYANLAYGQGFNVMYAINGSTKDMVYGALGSIGWSLEISDEKQPPQSQIQMYYNYNEPAMTEMVNRCGWGVEGTVIDSLTGEPVRSTIWVANYFPVYNDPVVGDFHKIVLPGTYSIRVEANGYAPKTINGVVVPAQGSVNVTIPLVREYKWAGYRVVSCQIPGNNFADEGYTPGALGRADSIFYALGKSGWIIIDMGDTIYDGPGADFRIIQHGSPARPYQVSGSNSMDGPFTVIGAGSGTTNFDFAAGLIHKCRYLKIKDTGTGPSTGTAIGLNLDAVEMLTPPLIIDFETPTPVACAGAPLDFIDKSIGSPSSWSWSFPGGSPSTSTQQNPVGIHYDTPGVYSVTLQISNGVSSNVKTKVGYITILESPHTTLGNDTTLCAWEQITLDAGNPGSTFLWSTGETTQTITVDSSGTGYGTKVVSVVVTSPNGCSDTDSLSVTFDDCTSVPLPSTEHSFSLYPNPSPDGAIHVLATGYKDWKMEVLDSTGDVLNQSTILTEIYQGTILLRHPGLYILRLSGKQSIVYHKIIVY